MEDFLQTVLTGIEPENLVRMALAVVLGGLIGLEREQRSRPAGLRTMIIVCLGSTIIMIVSTQLATQYFTGPGEAVVRVDPGRIAAGIVTGIGFLGAGVVLKLGDIVRGVTTAACIWFVAAVGISIGQGHYVLATSGTLMALVVLWAFHYVELSFQSGVYRKITVQVSSEHSAEALTAARALLKEANATLQDLRVCEVKKDGETSLCFFVKLKQEFQSHELVKKLLEVPGALSVNWEAG